MKRSIRKIIRALPVDFSQNQKYDTLTKKIIRIVLEEDSTFVDVGSYKGKAMELALKFAPDGYHYGFEPIPHLYKNLKKKFQGKKCKINNLGLGETRGKSTFNYVRSNPENSSLKNSGDKKEKIERLEIEIDSLNNQLYGIKKVNLIKLNLDGGELEVLKGASHILKECNPVIIFKHFTIPSDTQDITAETWAFYEEYNYNLYTLKSFVENPVPLTRGEFEKLTINNQEYAFVARFKA